MYAESWQILSIALSCLAAAIQIAGLAAPVWIWMEADDEHVRIGLFYREGFELDDGATVNVPQGFEKVTFDSDNTLDSKHWAAMSSMEVVSTVAALILIPVLVYFHRHANVENMMFRTFRCALWLSIFAWLFNTVGLIIFMIYHGDLLTEGPEISSESFSWGGLICACGLLLHVCLTLIIYQFIWPDENNTLPPKAPTNVDPRKDPAYPQTNNANLTQFFQSYYNQTPQAPPQIPTTPPPASAMNDVAGVRNSQIRGKKTPPPITQPRPSRDLSERAQVPSEKRTSQPYQTRQELLEDPRRLSRMDAARRSSQTKMSLNDPRRPSTDLNRVDAIYGNERRNDFQDINGQAGFDNEGFAPSTPLRSPRDVQPRQFKTTILDRHNDRIGNTNNRGGYYEEERVFNRIPQSNGNNNNNNNDQRRSSIYRELYNIDAARRKSGEFLQPSKPTAQRDILSNMNRSFDQGNTGQVLSPSNLTESNVKHHSSFIYRPYSESNY